MFWSWFPTRELAQQVFDNLKKFIKGTDLKGACILGGSDYESQKRSLAAGVDFLIATPGRLIDLYRAHKVVDFNQVSTIIFDEADRMFDMGFRDDMRYVLQRVDKERQFLGLQCHNEFRSSSYWV